jgi:DNA-binding CsgD family transcriptional regulator
VRFELGRARLEATGDDVLLARLAPRHTDAARHLARHHALAGRPADAVAVLRAAPAPDEETRLELLAEATIAAAAIPGARSVATPAAAPPPAAAATPPAASPSRVPAARPRTPAQLLLYVAERIASGELPDDPVAAARDLLALRLHRHFPTSYAVGELTFSSAALLINGDALDDAERAMDALRDDATHARQPGTIAGAHWQDAQIAYQRGDLARCEAEAHAAVEIGGALLRPLAEPWRVLALVEQGRLDEADALAPAEIGPSGLLAAALGSRGRLRLAQHALDAAIADLAAAKQRAAAFYALRVEPPWQPLLVEALTLAGRTEEADAEAGAYARAAEHWGTARAQGHLARMRALTAPREQAIALLETAARHFARVPLERARTLVELGARQGAAGARTTARSTLREAFDVAHACGAAALSQRAREELRLVGGRPRTPAGAELTPAERRVADLAAAGATNREIARRLFLSPKTIEMHLGSAYRKLGVEGRTGLGTG